MDPRLPDWRATASGWGFDPEGLPGSKPVGHGLPSLLRYDRNSMTFSIENRVPFLIPDSPTSSFHCRTT